MFALSAFSSCPGFYFIESLLIMTPGSWSRQAASQPMTVINENTPLSSPSPVTMWTGSKRGRQDLNVLISCVGFPNSVGPKDVGVVEALSGPSGCGGVQSTCHDSLICSGKVAWGLERQ